jgi:hypothetical protein
MTMELTEYDIYYVGLLAEMPNHPYGIFYLTLQEKGDLGHI